MTKYNMLAVGEVLFDVIEGENKLGGAPFNVAAHLARLGHQSFILSAIGTDQLGDQILTEAADLKVSTELIHRNPHKPTGTVQVQFADGEPQYDIIENVAWDELQVDFEKVRERQWEIVVFGSLAQRSSHNRLFFEKLFDHLSVRWPYFDCNLRQNYYDQKLLERSFHWAKICKFNEHELNLSSKLLYGRNLDARDFASRLNRDFEVELVVYTWGKDGSRAWYQDEMYVQSSEKIKVADTIGAGDARLKVMAQLDISERRVPQDGRIKLRVSRSKSIDFRVNTCPTLFGEKIVLRILDSDSAKLGIDVLGYEDDQKELYLEALHKPQGMVLVTGPTGSGKTVSLYTGVNILNTPERNISTAEDPVEINLEGVNQVNVNPRQGMDFAAALKAFLRQDPDVILVGEIRDLETANIAVAAAQTGHLVLSTLHTNSAPETLTRLRNMGVPSFNIATSVILIIAQRLARRLCNDCKEEADIPEKSLREFGFTDEDLKTGFTVYAPKGCDNCNNGYKGRVGIYEVVKITDAIARIIMEEGNSMDIADQCRAEGFNDIYRSGLLKVMQGVTSLEEINRVTSG